MKQCTLDNPVNKTLKVLGGKWKPLILWFLKEKTMRFSELSKELEGITQKMLTQELRQLEADGLVDRKVYAQVPPKVEYSISEYGKSLTPVIKALADWGKNHKMKGAKLSA